MQVVRCAKYVGTMIGPDGHVHRWTAHRKNHPARFENHCSTACDCKIYAISVLSFIGSLCAPDKAALKAEAHALQCTTAGPYNAYLLTFLELALYVVLVLTWWVFTP